VEDKIRSPKIPIRVYLPMEDPVARRWLDSDEVRQVLDPADRWQKKSPIRTLAVGGFKSLS